MCGGVAAATTEGEQLEKVFTFKNSPSSPKGSEEVDRAVLVPTIQYPNPNLGQQI